MKALIIGDIVSPAALTQSRLTGSCRRTLDAIFHHPAAQDLEWSDVVGLIGEIGQSREEFSDKFVFEVAGRRHVVRKPHTKDLTGKEVIDLRYFLVSAGAIPAPLPEAVSHPDLVAPDLSIVEGQGETTAFHVALMSETVAKDIISSHDPRHFLHDLKREEQSRVRGQRAAEEPNDYARIADAVALGGKVVVIADDAGNSNAVRSLTEDLRANHPEAYERVVVEAESNLSNMATTQLVEIARTAFLQ